MDNLSKESKNEVRSESGLSKWAKANKKIFITIGVALLLIITIWIWKSIEINNIKAKAESVQLLIKKQAASQIIQSHESHLKLLAKPYVWAVRSEMMRGNINQLNLFANDMIKENKFQLIAVANDKGIIVSSTNKKHEGQAFSTIGRETGLTDNNTTVENVNDTILIMTSPIMGFNNRLGTLLIKYAIQPLVFQVKE